MTITTTGDAPRRRLDPEESAQFLQVQVFAMRDKRQIRAALEQLAREARQRGEE